MKPNTEERIGELTNKLAILGKSKDWKSNWYAIIRKRKSEDNYLDCLARLLTGDEICVAIFLTEEKLLVASNLDKPKYAKPYLEKLREFIDNPSEEIYSKLMELAFKEIIFHLQKKDNPLRIKEIKDKYLILELINEFQSFLKKVKTYCRQAKLNNREVDEILNNLVYNENKLWKIEELFKKSFWEIKKIEKNNSVEDAKFMWSCLAPLHDVHIIVNAICANKIDERIIKAIKKNQVEYIEENVQTDRVLHAEMKIIERIFAKKIFSNILCVGIAKSPCAPCWIIINLLQDTIFEKPIFPCGTHGGIYYNWKVPNIHCSYQLWLLRELETISNKSISYRKRGENIRNRIPWHLSKTTYKDLEKTIQKSRESKKKEAECKELEWENKMKVKFKTRIKRRIKLMNKKIKEEKIELSRERRKLKQVSTTRLNERSEKFQIYIQQSPKFS